MDSWSSAGNRRRCSLIQQWRFSWTESAGSRSYSGHHKCRPFCWLTSYILQQRSLRSGLILSGFFFFFATKFQLHSNVVGKTDDQVLAIKSLPSKTVPVSAIACTVVYLMCFGGLNELFVHWILQWAVRFSNNHGNTAKCVGSTKPKMKSQILRHVSERGRY